MITVLPMFSKILIKLIDQAIVPAIVLLATRIVSVVLISKYYGYDFYINSSGITFKEAGAYMNVNSYSIFYMIVVLTAGLSYVILKSYIFHDSHIKPSLTAKLFSFNMSSLIQNSFEVYSQGAIWLSYAYLLTIVTGIMSYFSIVYSWVFYVSLSLTVLSTVLFILDVENEIKIEKTNDVEYDKEVTYLRKENNL